MSRPEVIRLQVTIAAALAASWCGACDCRFALAYSVAMRLVERPRSNWGRA